MCAIGSRGRKQKRAEFDLAPDATSMPFQAKGRPFSGKAGYLVGAAVCAAFSCTFYRMWKSDPELVYWIVAAVAGLGALVFAAVGFHYLLLRECWQFTPAYVECEKRGVLRSRKWREPLSDYQGVLTTESEYHVGRQRHTVYILQLKHRTKRPRSVKLYVARSPEGFRAKQEHYARLMKLPILIETDSGVEERAVEDLDKSVRQRVAEGTLRVTFDPSSGPPGKNLAVAIEGDRLRIWSRKGTLGLTGSSIIRFLLLGGSLVNLIFIIPAAQLPGVLLAIGTVSIVVGVVIYLGLRVCREELLVSRDELRRHWRHPWGTWRKQTMPSDQIEEVVIRRPIGKKKAPASVQAISDKATIAFGLGLKQPEKEWVRDCIIAVISK